MNKYYSNLASSPRWTIQEREIIKAAIDNAKTCRVKKKVAFEFAAAVIHEKLGIMRTAEAARAHWDRSIAHLSEISERYTQLQNDIIRKEVDSALALGKRPSAGFENAVLSIKKQTGVLRTMRAVAQHYLLIKGTPVAPTPPALRLVKAPEAPVLTVGQALQMQQTIDDQNRRIVSKDRMIRSLLNQLATTNRYRVAAMLQA
jgi:hypothetical protein